MNKEGILVVVSGFSGAGKGTLMKTLRQRYDNYALSISATTRTPREGEQDGVDYFFVSREKFDQMVHEDSFLEYATYVNHSYGTPKAYVQDQMANGKDVILEIEIQGALKIKEAYPNAVLLFIIPPNAGELKCRLVGRGTESEEVIQARLKRAAEEADSMEHYDYLLINDQVEQCVLKMHQIIEAQHNRVIHNLDFMNQIKAELKKI